MGETVVERVWALAEPLDAHEGLEIVDVEFRREGRGMVLRLFLDREGGVTLGDLTRMSRQLGDVFDVHDAVPGAYTLEVSSPGINRRLRRPVHFRRYLGETVRVRTVAPVEGRRNFHGKLADVGTDGIGSRARRACGSAPDALPAGGAHDAVRGQLHRPLLHAHPAPAPRIPRPARLTASLRRPAS